MQAVNACGLGKFSAPGRRKTGWPAPAAAPVFADIRGEAAREDAEAEGDAAEADDEEWCGVSNGGATFSLQWEQPPDFEAELLGGGPTLNFNLEQAGAGGSGWKAVYSGSIPQTTVPLAPLEPFTTCAHRLPGKTQR